MPHVNQWYMFHLCMHIPDGRVFLCNVYTLFLLPSPPLSFLHSPTSPLTHPVSSGSNQQLSRDKDCLQQWRFVAANVRSIFYGYCPEDGSVGVCDQLCCYLTAAIERL